MEEVDLVDSHYLDDKVVLDGLNFVEGSQESFRRGEDTMFELQDVSKNQIEEPLNYFSDAKLIDHLNVDSDSDEEDSRSPFEKRASKMTPIKDDGGVLKRTTKAGTGDLVAAYSSVRFHSDAYVEYAEEPFDSTYLRGKPFRVRLGQSSIVPGLEIALLSMQMNERAEFLVKPDYAFGKFGCPPRIPADATILYKIELLDFNTCLALSQLDSMTFEERKSAPFTLIYSAAESEKKQGNIYFKNGHNRNAFYRYHHAIRLLDNANLANDEDEDLQKQMLVKLYCNVCKTKSNLGDYSKQAFFARKALDLDNTCVKAKYNLANALIGLNSDLGKARSLLTALQRQHPNNSDINNSLEKLERRMNQNKMMEREFCLKMFKKTDVNAKLVNPLEIKDSKGSPSIDASNLFKRAVTARLEAFSKSDSATLEFSINDSISEKNFVVSECCRLGIQVQTNPKDSLRLIISKKS